MFIGHFAVAFAAKRAAPGVSLGMLFVAAQLPDMIWPVLVLAGVEKVRIVPGITAATPLEFVSYPYSHSLLFVALWAALLAAGYALVRRSPRAALWIAASVLSHWILDVISHRPDVPLLPAGPLLGLGLWESRPATVVVEGLMFGVALSIYVRCTVARSRAGRFGLAGLVALLLFFYIGAVFGPPPPSVAVVAWSGVAGWLLVVLAYWVDIRRRSVRIDA